MLVAQSALCVVCTSADTVSLKRKALLLEEIRKLNQHNAEQSVRPATPERQDAEAGDGLPGSIPSLPQTSLDRSEESRALSSSEQEQDEEGKATQLEESLIVNEEGENEGHFTESEHEEEVEDEEEDEGTEYELQTEETEITDGHLPLPAALSLERCVSFKFLSTSDPTTGLVLRSSPYSDHRFPADCLRGGCSKPLTYTLSLNTTEIHTLSLEGGT